MTPQHDEIVRDIGGGFSIAWDTTRVDKAKLKKVRAVARERSAELGRIIDDRTNVIKATGSAPAGKHRNAGIRSRTGIA